jgi:hypothetical protein
MLTNATETLITICEILRRADVIDVCNYQIIGGSVALSTECDGAGERPRKVAPR